MIIRLFNIISLKVHKVSYSRLGEGMIQSERYFSMNMLVDAQSPSIGGCQGGSERYFSSVMLVDLTRRWVLCSVSDLVRLVFSRTTFGCVLISFEFVNVSLCIISFPR